MSAALSLPPPPCPVVDLQQQAAWLKDSVVAYMPLVQQSVRRFLRKLPANVSKDDLTAAGVFGLMDALRKNGGSEGPAFEWYARIRIRGAIVDELRQQDWLPRRARWAADGKGDSKRMGVAATAVVSLEDIAVGEQSMALIDEQTANPAEQAEANDTRARLGHAVSMLPDRERLIVSMHYFEGIRFKEIGGLLGVSEPRISQLHARAMDKLRALLRENAEEPRTSTILKVARPIASLANLTGGEELTTTALVVAQVAIIRHFRRVAQW